MNSKRLDHSLSDDLRRLKQDIVHELSEVFNASYFLLRVMK